MFSYYFNRVLKKLQGCAVKKSRIHKTAKIEAGSQVINSNMGRYSFCGYNCKILNCNIGSFCSIADNVVIGGAQHPMTWISSSPVFYAGRDSIKKKFSKFNRDEEPITDIGNDVWIGEGAFIKGGIHIGDGAVIGMGSVVTKNVGPYEIWVGNPAYLMRKRFEDTLISYLEESKWWDEPDEIIKLSAPYCKDPVQFINKIKEHV